MRAVIDYLANLGTRDSIASERSFSLMLMVVSLLCASAAIAAAEPIDYEKQIKPVFVARCKACHGVLKQEGGLRLDTGALARQGGDSGKVVIPGKSDSSPLVARITSDDPSERMPQEGEPLKQEQIAA